MNSICIPKWQQKFHLVTEIASVLYVPWVLTAAAMVVEPHKSRLKLLAYAMVLVDGYLVFRWWQLLRK